MNIKLILLSALLITGKVQTMEKPIPGDIDYVGFLNYPVPMEVMENIILKADSIDDALNIILKFQEVNKVFKENLNNREYTDILVENLTKEFAEIKYSKIFLNKLLTQVAGSYELDKVLNKFLIKAAENHELDKVLLLIKLGADVNAKETINVLPHLVQDRQNFGIDVKQIGDKFYYFGTETSISKAIENHLKHPRKDLENYENTVSILLPHITDQSIKDRALLQAAESRSTKVIDMLLKAGANPNTGKYSTPLIEAVKQGRQQTVNLLIGASVDINAQDHRGRTALMYAAERNLPRIVQMLLWRGRANTSLKDKNGQTALDMAIKNKNTEVTNLINNGPTVFGNTMRSALNYIESLWQ